MVSMLQMFCTADLQCQDRCGHLMLQTFNVVRCSILQPLACRIQNALLPPRLTSHVHVIMFIHAAMIFIILPQLCNMCCWASKFSLYYMYFIVKFKTLNLTVEPGLATKLCVKALSSKQLKPVWNVTSLKVIRPGNWHKVIFPPREVLISTFLTNGKS